MKNKKDWRDSFKYAFHPWAMFAQYVFLHAMMTVESFALGTLGVLDETSWMDGGRYLLAAMAGMVYEEERKAGHHFWALILAACVFAYFSQGGPYTLPLLVYEVGVGYGSSIVKSLAREHL